MSMDDDVVRSAIREALATKDEQALNAIAFKVGLSDGHARWETYLRLLGEEVDRLPAELHRFWVEEPCNCHGRLN